jgi:hypothetical protein
MIKTVCLLIGLGVSAASAFATLYTSQNQRFEGTVRFQKAAELKCTGGVCESGETYTQIYFETMGPGSSNFKVAILGGQFAMGESSVPEKIKVGGVNLRDGDQVVVDAELSAGEGDSTSYISRLESVRVIN